MKRKGEKPMNKILKGIKDLGKKKSEPVNEKPMNKI